MVQEGLDEIDRQTCRLCERRASAAEIMGREGRKLFRNLFVGQDAANGLTQRMPGKGGNALEAAGEYRLVVRLVRVAFIGGYSVVLFVPAGLKRIKDQPYSGR
jgi:hypothetical protein